MNLSLEKFNKNQKILGIILIIVFLVLIVTALVLNNKQPSVVGEPEVTQPEVIPPMEEKPNDLTRDDGLLVDEYPIPDFPELRLSTVYGITKTANPPLQYNGQPRVFLDCGRLTSENMEFQKIIKKACVARLVSDGSVAILGGDVKNDYLYYRGKTRGPHTITLVHDISKEYEKTYLIYEYDYNTESSNYIDKISLVDPTKYLGDLYDYDFCPYDKIETYSDPKCESPDSEYGRSGNIYFLEKKDDYFRDVNLP